MRHCVRFPHHNRFELKSKLGKLRIARTKSKYVYVAPQKKSRLLLVDIYVSTRTVSKSTDSSSRHVKAPGGNCYVVSACYRNMF